MRHPNVEWLMYYHHDSRVVIDQRRSTQGPKKIEKLIPSQSRNLPFFDGLKLGHLLHVMELAIQKNILAYEDNYLLPACACRNFGHQD